MNKKTIINNLKHILAIEQNSSVEAFDRPGTTVVKQVRSEGFRRFSSDLQEFQVVIMGRSAVVSCSEHKLAWAQDALGELTPEEICEVGILAHIEEIMREDDCMVSGPHLKFSCATDTFKPYSEEVPAGITFSSHINRIQDYYQYQGFGHALQYDPDSERPDRVLITAENEQGIIGMAGASADCAEMWQIGVQVLPEYQFQGIGKALVSRLTAYLLENKIIPYYTTSVGNLCSQNLALAIGYWPAWVEIFAVK